MSSQDHFDGRILTDEEDRTLRSDRLPVKYAIVVWLVGAFAGWAFVIGLIVVAT